MTTIVLTAETAKTPLGDVLCAATDAEIAITDPAGKMIARIVLAAGSDERPNDTVIVLGSFPPSKASRDRSRDVTTQQLLDKLNRLGAE